MAKTTFLDQLIDDNKGTTLDKFMAYLDNVRKPILNKSKRTNEDNMKVYTVKTIIELLQGTKPVENLTPEELSEYAEYSDVIESLQLVIIEGGKQKSFLESQVASRYQAIIATNEQ